MFFTDIVTYVLLKVNKKEQIFSFSSNSQKIIVLRRMLFYNKLTGKTRLEKSQGGNLYENYTQVYVKNSLEAAQTYCEAFGAQITFEIKNPSRTAYEHCELSVDGEDFLAIGEAKNPCDVAFIHKMKWETMTFNVFEMGTEERVYHALDVLHDGGIVVEEIHSLPWSKCCATVIDKYGVCWWIAI